MDTAPKVSVFVITYNHGEWLRECLQSIVDQVTDFAYEIIVGDDCSTDGVTREILREFAAKYPSKIVPLLREANMGGGGTQNWLDVMRRARGQYLAHMDGDDRMLPGKLQKQADFLDRHAECAVVAHGLRTFDAATGTTLANGFSGKGIPEISDIRYLLIHRCFFGHSSKMFRRSAIITRERSEPTVDFFMHVEHASQGNIGYIHEILGEYRKSSSSATSIAGEQFDKIIAGYEDAYQRAQDLGAEMPVIKKGRLLFHYSLARQYLRSSDYDRFWKYIELKRDDWHHAAGKHRLVSVLAFSPKLLRALSGLNGVWLKVREAFLNVAAKVCRGN